jgi:hypothetical protein
MVSVSGFPRCVYPPDAAAYGKQPSVDGPDILAYKRTVSRAGRWPWTTFDDSFSNGFSHGSGGNVIDTGLAGVQRQQHIDATGWVGKATFNTLRSMLVPDGLPHAGEHCMDMTAANLINEAWRMFDGHEPPPVSLHVAAMDRAASQVGYVEGANNDNKYGEWYGANHQPWCAMFCTWCFETSGDSSSFVQGSRYAYVPYVVADAQAGRYGLRIVDDPQPGDLVCYDWQWDTIYDHIGLFERWSGANMVVIEGNTSTSSNSNGGQVMRRTRNPAGQRTVFVRPAA